jgi:hypothetical protein
LGAVLCVHANIPFVVDAETETVSGAGCVVVANDDDGCDWLMAWRDMELFGVGRVAWGRLVYPQTMER